MGMSAAICTPDQRAADLAEFIRAGGYTLDNGERIDVSGLTPAERAALVDQARANGSRYLVGRQNPLIPVGDGTHTLDRTRSDLILHMQPWTPIRPPDGWMRNGKS